MPVPWNTTAQPWSTPSYKPATKPNPYEFAGDYTNIQVDKPIPPQRTTSAFSPQQSDPARPVVPFGAPIGPSPNRPSSQPQFDNGDRTESQQQRQMTFQPPPQYRPMGGAPFLRLAGAGNPSMGERERLYRQRQRADDAHRRWSISQLRRTDGLVPGQMGTNRYASQVGMTGFGTPRNTTTRVSAEDGTLINEIPQDLSNDSRLGKWTVGQLRASDAIIPSQYGTNQFDSQRRMTAFGAPRDVAGKHLHRIWDDPAQYYNAYFDFH